MLNKNHFAQIRTCQRVKFDQAIYILTMYEKKIRNQITYNEDNAIDAQKQYEQKILRSWNGKWKMDLTKPLLNCVTSVSPRVLLDITASEQQQTGQQQHSDIQRYNQTMLQFIRRMRAQHEDQSNFKLTQIDINQKNNKLNRLKNYADRATKDILLAIGKILTSMKQSIADNSENIQLQQQDLTGFCLQIGDRIEDMLTLISNTTQNNLPQSFYKFITHCISAFDSIKESEQGSTLVTVQPQINQLTYLLHPMFYSFYGYFLRQKDQAKASKHDLRDNNKESLQDPNLPLKNFFSSNTNSLSKIVFINLDGYESQFNLQLARTFKKNLLYISFPKQDIHYSNDMNTIYEQRLYKKIMYNWQKTKMSYTHASSSTQTKASTSIIDEADFADKLYFITHNIENYYGNVQKYLHSSNNSNVYQDINKNMYVFPLRLNSLNQNFNNLIPEDQDDTIQVYQSYAILQIFKYFLVNQIKQFGPTFIVVSHSGRLHIQDNHFVQIMQQLTKLSHYKIVYFPNLTTRFCPKQKIGVDHQFSLHGIDYLQRKQADHQQQQMHDVNQQLNISFDFFNKIARFLKVSSGTYSLTKNFEQQDILSKYRNLKVLKKVNKLMQVLGNQFQNIQKIRFKNSEIDLIPKLYEKDAQKITKAFDKLVPLFYNQLYLLLQSILSVCYLPLQQKPYQILTKYNINPQQIRNNYIIRELIHYIQSKVVVRNARNEADKQMQSFQKIKKYLQCQKSKHFLQISQQKYQDSTLLYFKVASNAQIYDSVGNDGKYNLSGLVDVSFSNPNKQIKDVMYIYDSTQILYKTDQTKGVGPIPVLIMNHLPLQKKSLSKFDNYCSFINRNILNKINNLKAGDQGIQKIHEQKKQRPYPIKLYDQQNRQIIESKFQFRTQWNYCETQTYMILYWPQLFNFVQAVSHKLQGRNYQPPILNEFFLSKKQAKNDTVCFYKSNSPDNLAPRTGCSSYQFKDFVYIFGGFYQQSNNYLSLQRDITSINLSMYTHDQHRKIQASNIKDDLYLALSAQNPDQIQPNSYVRAKRQYQFFEYQDLGFTQIQQQQGVRNVIMLGGVGQNFIHPFSLLTYYYYDLKFDQGSGRLLKIKKNIVYNRSIPVNIRRPSKNMGIIKTPIRNKNQSNGKAITAKPQLTQPYSYARFRIVYKMQGGQLKYKFQYIFSQKDCKMLKQQLRKYDQERYEVGELNNNIRIQKIQKMNHLFMIQKFGSRQIVHMRLDVIDQNQQKQNQYKLTHESISFLNIINGNYICAIIKHPVFTNDRSILADCTVKSIENQNLSEDEASYVSLKPFNNEIKGDLTLHIIQASNVNLIYILHGYRLYSSDKIYQYQITNKNKKSKIITQIKPKKPVKYLAQKSTPKCCYSTFFYKRTDSKNEIICQSYLCFEEDKNIITKVSQFYDPTDSVNMGWLLKQPIIRYVFCLKNSNVPINLQRMEFVDFYRQEKVRILVIQYNRKKYIAKVEDEEQTMADCIRVQLQTTNQVLIRMLDQQQFQRGTILIKRPEYYIDRGYEKTQ